MSTSAPTPAHVPVQLGPADTARVVELEDHVWFEVSPGVSLEDKVDGLDWDRTRGVERVLTTPAGAAPRTEPALAGMYSAWGMGVSVPGPLGGVARVPMSGLTWVGVHQDERRRGIQRAMMTDHLHRVHEDGTEPIAGLHASEPGIYTRYGYGLATPHHTVRLGRGVELTAPEALDAAAREVRTHQVPADTDEASALVHTVHHRVAEATLGAITRADLSARAWWRDHRSVRQSKEPLQVLFATRGDETTGYAVFRRRSKWSDAGVPEGEVSVAELGALDSATLLALGRRLLDFDLTGKVEIWSRPADDPLLTWAGHPRGALSDSGDSLWVRLVDLPAALRARGYAAPADLVVQVADDVCPWNDGRWRLAIGADGTLACEPSTADPDLTLPVQVLGAAYVGGTTIASRAAVGQVVEHTPGAVRALSRAMRGDVDPVGAFGF